MTRRKPIQDNAATAPLSSDSDPDVRLPGLKRDLVTWALKYSSFRSELLAAPKAVVEKELGAKLRQSLEVRVLEETAESLYFVLPANPYEALLSEDPHQTLEGVDFRALARWASAGQQSPFSEMAGDPENPEARLIARAWQDASFKRALLSDPSAAIQVELGVAIPEEIELKVVEEDVDSLYIVLPIDVGDPCDVLGDYPEHELEFLTVPLVAGSAPLSIVVC